METFGPIVDLVIKGAGPAVIFAALWWLERKERIATNAALIRMLQSMSRANAVWEKVLTKHDGESDQ